MTNLILQAYTVELEAEVTQLKEENMRLRKMQVFHVVVLDAIPADALSKHGDDSACGLFISRSMVV